MTSSPPPRTEPVPAEPVSALAEMIAQYRPASRGLRRLVALLTGQPRDLASLVQESGLPRQTVEAVLAAVDGDLVSDEAGVVIQPAMVAVYRQRFGFQDLMRTELADPLAPRLAGAGALVGSMTDLVAHAPPAVLDLDHVPATPETVVRRALWLDSTYDLPGSVLLCVGDHDLTSLAVAQVSQAVTVVVVDVDEPTLAFIDSQAARLGLDVRCFAGDLRFGLPEPALACADLVFTDPPYTPEGVGLFAARGLQGLRNRDQGRVIVAYGYSDRHPTLGFQVQSVSQRLGLAYEMLLPAFNRYEGAQAICSAADLYVWRPTTRTWRGLDRFLSDAGTNIYTRGLHALEQKTAGHEAVPAAIHRVTTDAGFPIGILIGSRWEDPAAHTARLRLGTLLAGGIPAALTGRGPFAVAADLSADPGPWLLRTLLAANADRVAVLVPSAHPDVRNEAAQRSIAALLRPKYDLRFLRSQPDNQHTIVVAEAVDRGSLDPAARVAQRLLQRAHGKVGNVWREGLIAAGRERGDPSLTKREARAAVAARVGQAHVLEAPLMALPRHQVAAVLEAALESAEPPG
jgi:predicted methyltransferase